MKGKEGFPLLFSRKAAGTINREWKKSVKKREGALIFQSPLPFFGAAAYPRAAPPRYCPGDRPVSRLNTLQ